MRAFVCIVAAAVLTTAQVACSQPAVTRGATVFAEECSVSDLDRDWAFQNSSDPRPLLLSSRWRENVVVDQQEGLCLLEQRRAARGDKPWTSGHMWTQREFRYGYFEARLKFSAAAGIDNAFWLMSNSWTKRAPGQTVCEIDIVEGAHPSLVVTTLHEISDAGRRATPIRIPTDRDYSGQFHTFGLRWNKDEITWFIDGVQVRHITGHPCHDPLSIRLSTAVMRDHFGPVTDAVDNTRMAVDYVRVYAD